MARRPRPVAPGLLYHVIVRGNQRQKTFLGPADYRAYLERLGRYRERYGVTIYAYCLMPNHVHLLLETGALPLPKVMQSLQQSYTQDFNRRHRKVGHLFQGRYHAIVCDQDRYLLALVRYIHLNPVRARLVRDPRQYPYSGHQAYLAGEPTPVIDPGRVLRLLGGRGAYRRFVQAGREEGHQTQYYQVEDQRFLGDEAFLKRMRKLHEAETPGRRLRRPLAVALKNLAGAVAVPLDVLVGPERSWAVSHQRVLVAYTLVRRLGYRVNEVATALQRDATTLSSLLARFGARVRNDPALDRALTRVGRSV